MSDPTVRQLSLAPLGAGDLIDRAVRLYRRHLFVLIRTAALPVIIAALGGILMSLGFRQISAAGETSEVLLYLSLMFIGLFIAFAGHLFTLVVMGGSTRNLVAHLLHNDPVSARAAYSAVRARFWGLVLASFIVLSLDRVFVGHCGSCLVHDTGCCHPGIFPAQQHCSGLV
jgi:hypothetical protein